jgi:hypothetical protein
VRVPSGEIEVDRANEGALAYVIAWYGLPWRVEFDAVAMRGVLYAWYEDMQKAMAKERAHCEAFYRAIVELIHG